MTQISPPQMPCSVILDTNALRKANLTFNAPWFQELRAKANAYNIRLCIVDICLNELQEELNSRIIDSINSINRSQQTLHSHTGLKISIDLPSREQLLDATSRELLKRVRHESLQIIPNTKPDIDDLIHQAVKKYPPFESGDKGFRDTIIIESICAHHQPHQPVGEIWVLSDDKIFKRSLRRFETRSLQARILSHTEAARELDSRAFDVGLHRHNQLSEQLLAFLRDNFNLLESVISEQQLHMSSITLYGFESNRPELLKVYSVELESIDSAYPRIDKNIRLHDNPLAISIGITLRVDVEVERTHTDFSFLGFNSTTVQPKSLTSDGPQSIEPRLRSALPSTSKSIEREIVMLERTIDATISQAREGDTPVFSDLNVDKIDTSDPFEII